MRRPFALGALEEGRIERSPALERGAGFFASGDAAARLVLPGDGAKVPVSIRLDSEVIEYFKEDGPGYQSRINAVLLGYVRSRRERRQR